MSNDPITQVISNKGYIGYKSLALSQNSTILLSMHNFVWEPGKSVVSHCDRCGNKPDFNCGCGIYAHRQLDTHICSPYAQIDQPIVELNLWGIIHQFTEGYRAQYAKITKIFIPRSMLANDVPLEARRDALELSYMVSVEYVDLPGVRIGVNGNWTQPPRPKPLTIADYELFVNSDDENVRNFCRRELKKKYLQKIYSLKNRVQYATNALAEAQSKLAEFEAKRAKLMK
jgi:hypothetical protein